MRMIFMPIDAWPLTHARTKSHSRRDRPFSASWSDTLRTLDRELTHMRAKTIVLQTFHDGSKVRLDGMLRADAGEPRDPGVILSFESRVGNLMYPCDSCTRWRDNVRSIALGLEALRAVDRYGISTLQQQYKGWAKVEDYSVPTNEIEALRLLHSICKDPIDYLRQNPSHARKQLRTALTIHHPDAGGDGRMFRRLSAVKQFLGAAS